MRDANVNDQKESLQASPDKNRQKHKWKRDAAALVLLFIVNKIHPED